MQGCGRAKDCPDGSNTIRADQAVFEAVEVRRSAEARPQIWHCACQCHEIVRSPLVSIHVSEPSSAYCCNSPGQVAALTAVIIIATSTTVVATHIPILACLIFHSCSVAIAIVTDAMLFVL